MTSTELVNLIRRMTKTNSDTYGDPVALIDVNNVKDDLAGKIQDVRPEHWNMPFLDDLIDDQREYGLDIEILNNIKTLELKFSSSGNFVLAFPTSRFHYKDALQESKIVNDFNSEFPEYFIRRKAIYILSGTITAVTDGIRYVANIFPVNLTSLTESTNLAVDPSTTSHGFPREFHELWARGVSRMYKAREGITLSPLERRFEVDLVKKLDEFSVAVLDQEITGKIPPANERGENGFNY